MAPPQLVGFQCFYGSRHVEMNERQKNAWSIYFTNKSIKKAHIVNSKCFCSKSQRKTKLRHSTWTPGQIKQKRDLSWLPGHERFLRLFATVRLRNFPDAWWEPLRNARIPYMTGHIMYIAWMHDWKDGWVCLVNWLDAWQYHPGNCFDAWLEMSCKMPEWMAGNVLWNAWIHDRKYLVNWLNACLGMSCKLPQWMIGNVLWYSWMHDWEYLVKCLYAWLGISCELPECMTGNVLWSSWMHDWEWIVNCLNAGQGMSCEVPGWECIYKFLNAWLGKYCELAGCMTVSSWNCLDAWLEMSCEVPGWECLFKCLNAWLGISCELAGCMTVQYYPGNCLDAWLEMSCEMPKFMTCNVL